ncbi:MAG: hypothetical protein K8F59_06470 [Rhodobacteraceae bacterium]|nr:hypothetical protein [Paracoccaceae bacterium]
MAKTEIGKYIKPIVRETETIGGKKRPRKSARPVNREEVNHTGTTLNHRRISSMAQMA